jgi:hypothetical protein
VGGVVGRQLIGHAKPFPSYEAPQACLEQCVPLFGPATLVASGYTAYAHDARDLFDVLRVHGRPLVIWISSNLATFSRMQREAAQVLRTVRFA